MKRFMFFLVMMAMGLNAPGADAAKSAMPKYEHKITKELIAFVEAAAALVKEKGEAAFDAFRKEGGPWRKGELYVFVDTPEGVEVVNPAFPQYEGRSLINIKDANGKEIVRSYLKPLFGKEGKASAWSHYLWPQPDALEPSWKTSYLVKAQAPSGKLYAVGAGLYGMKTERYFIVERVNAAVRLIAEKGEAAFDDLRRRDGDFLFRNTYIFVDSEAGVEFVNPAFPGLEGRNIYRLENAEGRRIVMEYIALVKKKGEGWIGYYWPKPGETKPSIKHAYVRGVRHGGKLYIVGCGAYIN